MSLTQEQFAKKLAAKITSREAFDALLLEAHPANSKYMPIEGRKPGTAGYGYTAQNFTPGAIRSHGDGTWPTNLKGMNIEIAPNRWWAVRELLRYGHGVYSEREAPLSTIAQHFPQSMIHPSDTDPLMIAYTATPEDGERDKQLVTTLSKFCRKFWPVASDDQLRDIEAEYRAVMNGDVEFLTGSAIIDGYRNGPGACMSKATSSYSTGGVHPVSVYDAPGIAMAICRNSDGQISGRTMTYVNPDDPTDKRWIRCYGDAVLVRRLERKGFRCGNWEGVKFKRIPIKGTTDRYVMPYIDCNGGAASSSSCSVVLTEGWLRVLTTAQYRDSKFSGKYNLGNTEGYTVLARDCTEYFSFKCAIDGREYEANVPYAAIMVDDKLARVNPANIAAGEWLGPHKCARGNSLFSVYAKAGSTFEHGGTTLWDDAQTREQQGFVRLDVGRYTNAPWVLKDGAAQLPDGRWLRAEDCIEAIRMVNGKPTSAKIEVTRDHTTETMVAAGELVEVHRVGSNRTFAEPNVPFRETRSGAKVIRGIHKGLRPLPDNGMEFLRNVELRVVMEVRWYALANEISPLDVASIPTTNLLDRVFNDFATVYATQIVTDRRSDRGGQWGPGTWNNYMVTWLQHNRLFERTIPVLAPSGTHIIAGSWPELPSHAPSANLLARQQYLTFAALCERICDGDIPFADSVDAQAVRRFIEMARITRVIRQRAARALGEFPHSLAGDGTIVATETAPPAPPVPAAPPAPVPMAQFLVAD